MLRLFNIFSRKYLIIGLGFALFMFTGGCGSKPIMLMNAPLDNGEDVPIPPTPEELLTSKSFIAFVPAQFSENLSRYHKATECELCAVCTGGAWRSQNN